MRVIEISLPLLLCIVSILFLADPLLFGDAFASGTARAGLALNGAAFAPHEYGLFDWSTQVSRLILLGAAAVLATATVLRTQEPILSPTWSADGRFVAYATDLKIGRLLPQKVDPKLFREDRGHRQR